MTLLIGFQKGSPAIAPYRALAATLFVFLVFCKGAPAQRSTNAVARVALAAETVATKERLTLGDIADVFAEDESVAGRLRSIDVGYAPDVGALRELPQDKIALLIAAAGFTSDAILLQGAQLVVIRRATQKIDASYLREAVERAIVADSRAVGCAARLSRLDVAPSIEVPAGATEVRASISRGQDLFGPFTATIEIWADGRVLRKLNVSAQAEAFAPIAVAAHDLASGARVHADDVTIELRKITRAVSNYYRDPNALKGLTLRRGISRGEPLTSDATFADIIVKPGDPVRIIGESRWVLVEVKGEARGAGHVGDRIPVKNALSGIVLQAVVEDEGVVRVRF